MVGKEVLVRKVNYLCGHQLSKGLQISENLEPKDFSVVQKHELGCQGVVTVGTCDIFRQKHLQQPQQIQLQCS